MTSKKKPGATRKAPGPRKPAISQSPAEIIPSIFRHFGIPEADIPAFWSCAAEVWVPGDTARTLRTRLRERFPHFNWFRLWSLVKVLNTLFSAEYRLLHPK